MNRPAHMILLLAVGCDSSVPPPGARALADAEVIGLSVERAIGALNLSPMDYVIEGPFRGVKGQDQKGEEVWLQVRWEGSRLLDRSAESRVSFVRGMKVVGLARRTADGWVVVGAVYYVLEPLAPPPK